MADSTYPLQNSGSTMSQMARHSDKMEVAINGAKPRQKRQNRLLCAFLATALVPFLVAGCGRLEAVAERTVVETVEVTRVVVVVVTATPTPTIEPTAMITAEEIENQASAEVDMVALPTPTPSPPPFVPLPTFTPASHTTPPLIEPLPTDIPLSGAAVAIENANLRSGPGTAYTVVGGALQGEILDLIGRTADGSWYHLAENTWIAAALVGDAPADLPVVSDTPSCR